MLTNIIEALIFASGTGLNIDSLTNDLEKTYSLDEIKKAYGNLEAMYSGERGVHLIKFNNTYQFQSNPEYGTFLADILMETRERELSKTLMQVLAIVAYKQPTTRQDIEDLRGVNSDYVIAMLLKLNLIEPQGRKDTVGHPILYGTTDEFLKKFGLESVDELPDYEEIMHKIRTNYDKYYAKSEGLYHDRVISWGEVEDTPDKELEKEVAAAELEGEELEEGDELPDFLKNEDIIEVE